MINLMLPLHWYPSVGVSFCEIDQHISISDGSDLYFTMYSYLDGSEKKEHLLHLADAFIQSDLQLIRLSMRQFPLEQCGVKGPTAVQILSWDRTPGIEPPTLRVQVK